MEQLPSSFLNFAKAVFLLGGRYHVRNIARQDLHEHIHRIRQKAHTRKHISVNEINHIEEKMHHLIEKEKKLHSFNAVEQEKLGSLMAKVAALEARLYDEREKKQKLEDEKEILSRQKNEEIAELRERLVQLKKGLHGIMHRKHFEIERKKRNLEELDRRINKEIRIGSSY